MARVKVALHDADRKGKRKKDIYPNLALAKISAHQKAMGADVEWFSPLLAASYDQVYSSKVFTFSEDDDSLPDSVIKGGTGYHSPEVLSDEVEHICPDYDLYGKDCSMGFLTRGCSRNCDWCAVPKTEGNIRAHADIEEFTRHKKVVLMDNNVLAHSHGITQIEKIARMGLEVDFNQGLDARLIDDGVARRLGKLKWIRSTRLACDHKGQIESVRKAVELLRWHNCNPARVSCYVLVKDIDDALERVRFLKGIYVDPFAQPYRDPDGTPPSKEQRNFARYVNKKQIFKTTVWDEYDPAA
jgi:hypothetical protein